MNKNTVLKILVILFVPIVLVALAVSGNATYEVLTQTVGTNPKIAAGAAAVIDLSAIWLGLFTALLTKQGDDPAKAQYATRFVIFLSLAVNFYHGFVEGSAAGGAVGIIFPLLAAILFEFFIWLAIQEELRKQGAILPRKPSWVTDRKAEQFRDMDREARLERDYVQFSYERAEHQMRLLRDSVTSNETSETELVLDETSNETDETQPVHVESHLGTDEIASETDDIANQVDQAFAEQILRDINETMSIKEIVEVLIDQGIRDYKTAQQKISEIKPDTKPDTVRTTMRRVLNSRTDEIGNETA